MNLDIIARLETFYSKKVFKNFDRVVVFCEFFGEHSFAGNHDESDEKQLKLFDVNLFKKGFVPPKDFVNIFDKFENVAELMHYGNLNASYIQEVRANQSQLLNEGVICKGLLMVRLKWLKSKLKIG